MTSRIWTLSFAVGLLIACTPGALHPVDIRIGEDACAHCRMTIVSAKTGSQIIAPGAEPVMFDDADCLRGYLSRQPLPADAVVFVADHRTGEWVKASRAVFTRTSERTPMGSGIIAHADQASRNADPAALHGDPVTIPFILQPPAKGDVP